MVIGKTVDEALQLTNKAVAEALDGLPPVKMHCSLLAEQAIKAAIKDHYIRTGQMTPEREELFAVWMRDRMTLNPPEKSFAGNERPELSSVVVLCCRTGFEVHWGDTPDQTLSWTFG